jgi:flagellar secretion chaperone FliS
MHPGVYQEYLDNEILTADPVKLIQLMYRGALESVSSARAALAAGDIFTRSRLISKSVAIINELALSLDHSQDASLCRNLVELYDYMARRLNEANALQVDEPLAEVAKLLGEMLDAWQQVGGHNEAPPQPESYPSVAYASETGAEYQRVSYAW